MGTSPIWLGFAAMWDPAMMAEPITPNPANTEPVTREPSRQIAVDRHASEK